MIGIISDIHGNFIALEAVLDALDALGIERVTCLGDVGGYYCQINECCEALRARQIPTLMGNHDWYLTTGERCPRSTTANVCLDYQRGIITPENIGWLAAAPSSDRFYGLDVVHGGWHDPVDEYVSPSEEYFASLNSKYFASGHTHVQCIWKGKEKSYCNPGSVGQPRDGDPRAAFALWSGELFQLHRVAYDVQKLELLMEHAGFDSYYYENLKHGTRIGGKLSAIPPGVIRDLKL